MAWTDERVDLLKKLWADGLSASQIARQLGDVTRNAVIGKVHRLGLSGRGSPTRSERPRAVTVPKPQVKPVFLKPVPVEKPVVLENGEFATNTTLKENMCKWPIGDPATPNFRFCGHQAKDGTPYCDAHARVAYQPMERRRAKRQAAG
ncbi:MAG: GcrA family cell cycle regulator [Alphaproteobacteria bacterium]